jgi:formate transporter
MNFSGTPIWHPVCTAIRAFAVDADRNASPEGGQSISTDAVADLTMIVGAVSVMRRRGSPLPSRCNTAVRVASRLGYRDRGDRMCGSDPMDYVKPADVAAAMVDSASNKLRLAPRDLLIRGILSGAILGVATSLAFGGAVSTGQPLVGAIIFPIGLVMIVLLGLELVTGSFGLLPLAWLDRGATPGQVVTNWSWVFLGNLIGSVIYGALLAIALTNMGTAEPSGVAARIVAIAEAKTIGYASLGFAGLVTAFVKAILCNWLVCLAVVLAMTTTSTIGKIAAAWMPVFVFFAQGFEHAVVNMFVIPTGMLLGAKVSFADWWLWNQIPVTLGNVVGGAVFTGLAIYLTYRPKRAVEPIAAVQIAAE